MNDELLKDNELLNDLEAEVRDSRVVLDDAEEEFILASLTY